ncbi:MAG: cupin domain-containing protein [candidate division Zixibacteria bacterium]|nr:cupin domain-containing protein [candidate division Zixibacteria bacterium]
MPFVRLDDLERKEPVAGFKGHMVHTDNMTLAYWTIDAGAPAPNHSHPHEQVTSIIEGEFELTLDGETRVLAPGMVADIPANVPHSARAITDTRLIDIFHPVRDDYR